MNKGLKVRRGAGSFNKSVMFVTAPSGSTVTMQNMVRSDNLATDVQYQEASAKDQSCVTIKQCGEVSKGDRVRVSLEVTASKDAMGYWASESGLITDKREVNLKSGKQTVTLDITASGNLSLDTKFFCKGDDSDATITAANLQLYKYTAGTTIKTATEKNGVWRFNGLDLGLWLIKAEKESETPATQEFEIIEFGVYRTSLSFFMATIKITYPIGSTCTCFKGDRTYTAPNTTGTWDCVVDSAGEWTVQITADGEEPVSETVTITDDGQTVSVTLDYKLWLIRDGTENPLLIVDDSRITTTQEDGYIVYQGRKSGNHFAHLENIDTTKYSKLQYVGPGNENGNDCLIGLWEQSRDEGFTDTRALAYANVRGSVTSKTVDISNVNTICKAGAVVVANIQKLYIKSLYLER